MSEDPEISIIVPVFNTGEYLCDLFDSLSRQTFGDYELIFVNDGSTDNSLEILNGFAEKDGRVQVISQENLGGAAARNKGLSEAKGKFVICLDSDDFFEVDFLQKMIEPFSDPSVDLVYCNMNKFHEDTGVYESMPWAVRDTPASVPFEPSTIPNLYYEIMGYIANKMFKRSLVEDNNLRFQEIRSHDDLSFVYTLLSLSNKLQYVNEELYHYRKRRDESSVTDTTMSAMYECAFYALEDLKSNLIRLNLWEDFENVFINYAIYLFKWKYDTAPEDVKVSMLEDLRDEWLRKLDLIGHPRKIYLHDDEYDFLSNMLFHDEHEKIHSRLRKLRKKTKRLEKENEELSERIKELEGSKSFKFANVFSRKA